MQYVLYCPVLILYTHYVRVTLKRRPPTGICRFLWTSSDTYGTGAAWYRVWTICRGLWLKKRLLVKNRDWKKLIKNHTKTENSYTWQPPRIHCRWFRQKSYFSHVKRLISFNLQLLRGIQHKYKRKKAGVRWRLKNNIYIYKTRNSEYSLKKIFFGNNLYTGRNI